MIYDCLVVVVVDIDIDVDVDVDVDVVKQVDMIQRSHQNISIFHTEIF